MGSSPTEPTRPWLARGVWGLIATVPPNRDLIARGLKNAKFNHTGSSLMTFKEKGEGRIEETRAESQWIVAARPLCHLQYPVAYLSRLQRILPAARWEFIQGVPCGSSAARDPPTTRAFGSRGPYCWSANGRRAHASLLARILT